MLAWKRPLTALAAMTLAFIIAGCSARNTSSAPNGSAGAPNGSAGAPAPRTGGAHGSDFAPEIQASDDPQSTFGLDVDTASYSYASALIGQGRLPSPETVRQEEFINALPQSYPSPAGNGFSVIVDGARMPTTFDAGSDNGDGGGDVRLLRIGLRTRGEDPAERPDALLTFVIDVSGSMGDESKLGLVRNAMHALVDQLRPTDAVAIVTFNDTAHTVRPMTPISRRSDLHRAIDGLAAGGSTNLEAGLVAGYNVARDGFRAGATNRVVILSDGLANTGDTDSAKILEQVSEQAGKQITLLGVGVGNDYGDRLMEALADHGDGFVIYVSDPTQARQVFIDRLPATQALRALDAKAQVTFDPETVDRYRLIGYDDRAMADSSFRDDHVDGGEVLAGHTVTALYAVRLHPGASGDVATARIRWLDPSTRVAHETGRTVSTADLSTGFTGAAPSLRACYSAGYFAEVLRHSPFAAQVRLSDLANIASAAADALSAAGTGGTAVTELAGTIRRAIDLQR
jgi:Ca-activated chloride channel family protein